MKVACIGLGAMGWPMAKNLKSAGHEVLVYTRTAEKAKRHEDEHGTQAATLAGVAEAEVIFSCLPTSNEVEEVARALLDRLRPGTIWVDCTSGEPEKSREVARMLEEKGVFFLDAPVSGGTAGAEAGTLTIMVGGDEAAFARVRPLLTALGKRVIHVGPVGAGHATKAVNNTMLAANLLAAAEGLLALSKAGVPLKTALEVINGSSGRSFATEVLFPERVLDRSFPLTFKLGLLAKDVRIGNKVVEGEGVPAPVFHLVRELFEIAKNELGEDADHVKVVKLVERWGKGEIK